MARVIVIGGHGKIALQLARMLSERGDEVSSVFRNPEHSDDVAGTGAKPVVADIEQLDTNALANLLAGHDAVVFSAGAGGGLSWCLTSAPVRITGYRGMIHSSHTLRPRRLRMPTSAPASWIGRCWDLAGSPWNRLPAGSQSARAKQSRGPTSRSS